MKYVKTIDPVTTWHLLQDNPENAAYFASSLIKSPKTDEDSENYWFPTPEEPGDPQTHTHTDPTKNSEGTTSSPGIRETQPSRRP